LVVHVVEAVDGCLAVRPDFKGVVRLDGESMQDGEAFCGEGGDVVFLQVGDVAVDVVQAVVGEEDGPSSLRHRHVPVSRE
jgi:hypothetical protein